MPMFDTPSPVRMALSVAFGQVRIVASDRAETTAEAYPLDSLNRDDIQAAERLRIGYADGQLFVNDPWPGRSGGSAVVAITAPTGSSLHALGVATDFLGVGELGDCRLRTDLGRIGLDRTGSLQLTSFMGDITVGHVAGTAEALTDCGDIHLGRVEGAATISAKGECDATVREVRGSARLSAEKGDVRIDRACADVEARTTQGNIGIGSVARGSVVAATTFGDVRIGVAGPSGARLSLDSCAGTVYTSLSLVAARERTDEVVRIHARTVIGDIVVERSCPDG
ncbi:DUF4097 family beta strand repeat-containing protein [Streptomyces griseus]|uniref:DUF4097 family beta strand repeat-containing protein n=1 Tax=Streptomyces griseus TaxID=1911 RepID=UPI000D13FE3B|nr:DUF4097 family beta strand repeat-containing protein [Streptomyces griseus]